MAFTQFTNDMDIIAKLSDSPNVDDGFSADQLKAKFDEGGKALKDYINNVLLVEALEKPRFTGLVKSNGRGFVQAEAGKDYMTEIPDGSITPEKLDPSVVESLQNAGSVQMHYSSSFIMIDNWDTSTKKVTISAPYVKADKTKCHVFVDAGDDMSAQYMLDYAVRASGQSDGRLTFSCRDIPPMSSLSVNILVLEG